MLSIYILFLQIWISVFIDSIIFKFCQLMMSSRKPNDLNEGDTGGTIILEPMLYVPYCVGWEIAFEAAEFLRLAGQHQSSMWHAGMMDCYEVKILYFNQHYFNKIKNSNNVFLPAAYSFMLLLSF